MGADTPVRPLLSAKQWEQFIRDGYIRVLGLFSSDVAASTRAGLLDRMGVNADDPDTWAGKSMSTDPDAIAFTEACCTPLIEAAVEAVAT